MTTVYDNIAWQYKKSKELPVRQHVETYTYFHLIGEMAGKTILDLACGEGFYTAKKPLGIEYIVGDVIELKKIGNFDLVVASFLLNYAQTKEQLLKMCHSIYANLKPGARFVSINNNSEQPPESYHKLEKYGVIKSIVAPLQDGTPITIIWTVKEQQFSFDNYYISKATHEWAFQCAGFKEIRWHSPMVSPDGVQAFDQTYWQDIIDYVPFVGIECFK